MKVDLSVSEISPEETDCTITFKDNVQTKAKLIGNKKYLLSMTFNENEWSPEVCKHTNWKLTTDVGTFQADENTLHIEQSCNKIHIKIEAIKLD